MKETTLDKVKKVYELLAADPACSSQSRQVEALRDKLENRRMTVSIIGQFKRGKSTLANTVLEDEILPVGIVPITSAVTKVYYGKKDAEIHFSNGVIEQVPFDDLHKYISEQENSGNKLKVESVILHTPSKFLKNGMVFVDTPGVGSFHKNNTETAYQYMKESDAVVFLLSPDSPINQIEIDFLTSTREFAGRFYFTVNKTDLVCEDDLSTYVDYCKGVLRNLMNTPEIFIFKVSSKTGEGIDQLKDAILRDCKKSASEILEESTAKKLKDIITAALTHLDFYWKAMNMEYKELDERFGEISNTIDAVKSKSQLYEGAFEIHLNEIKMELSQRVMELFGMEYRYDITELPQGLLKMDKEEFLSETKQICEDLRRTLDKILLYREENAYTVVRRINNINKLSRQLRRIQSEL